MVLAALLAQSDPQSRSWNQPVAPFRIAGNIYYVGATEITSFLIATPNGHIVVDGGFVETAPQILANIRALGFRPEDVKVLLNSHAHLDHAGGLAALKKATGASLQIMEGDDVQIEKGGRGDFAFGDRLTFPPVRVDKVLHDGDVVALGGTKLVARRTAGHTKGCTTWTLKVPDGGKIYDVVIVGSVNVNPGFILVGNKDYPQIAEDYVRTFKILQSLPVDVFLGAHGNYYGMEAKYTRIKAGAPNPFIDPDGYHAYLSERQRAFQAEWDKQKAAAK